MEARELRIDVNGALLDLEMLTEEYGLRTDLTHQVKVEGLDGRLVRLLRVLISDFNVYLVETPHILRYVSHPYISGESLEVLMSENSPLLRRIVDRFTLRRFGSLVAADELIGRMGIDAPHIQDLSDLGDVVAAIPTPATSESIEAVHSQVRERGGRLRVVLFIGPMGEEDVHLLGDAANSLGVDSIFLAPALLGSRDSGGRLMAYGVDLDALRRGRVVTLGSVVDPLTLCRLLREYPPGMDISGLRERMAPDPDYLRSLLEDLIFLMEQPLFEPWQVDILLREAKNLRRQLMRYEGR